MTNYRCQKRNLDPHAAAVVAMWLWGTRYASFGGGSMDFWDSLSQAEKKRCADMAKDIRNTRPYTGSLK